MNRVRQHSSSGLGATLTLSLALHLVFFFLLGQVKTGLVPLPEQVCYVDVADFPVESPGAGMPAPAAPPAAAPAAPPAEMTAPSPQKVKPQPAGKQPAAATAPAGAADEGEEVARRIAGMGERRHQEDAVQAIAQRLAASQKAAAQRGSATGGGSRPGSDYGAYIQSRLQDNFLPPRNPGKNPHTTVRITIDRNGSVTSHLEQASDDKMFDIAVLQAVTMAKKTFPPPPDGREFSRGFVFRLQGVESK